MMDGECTDIVTDPFYIAKHVPFYFFDGDLDDLYNTWVLPRYLDLNSRGYRAQLVPVAGRGHEYFPNYMPLMWTYLTAPFLFAMDGVATEELPPWHENGELWRRLKVAFPPSIATHGTIQTFYVGSDGLLTRHDYDADVLGGTLAAHYLHDYQEVSGVLVPTRRRVLGRMPDGTPAPSPLIVAIDLSDVEFT